MVARVSLNDYYYAIFIFDRQNLNLMEVFIPNVTFLSSIFTRDKNGLLVLLISSCSYTFIMKVDETKSDYFSDGVSRKYTFISNSLYFTLLICSFIVYFISFNDTKNDEVNDLCKRVSGVGVSENQDVYYSMIVYNQNYLYQNYISTSIFKANSNLQSSECNLFSISYEGNKINNWSLT